MAEAADGNRLALAEVRTALEALAQALARADLDGLLASEARIQAALDGLPTRGLRADDRAMVVKEVEAARAALVRCRRLGQALDGFVAARMVSSGLEPADIHSLNTTV